MSENANVNQTEVEEIAETIIRYLGLITAHALACRRNSRRLLHSNAVDDRSRRRLQRHPELRVG